MSLVITIADIMGKGFIAIVCDKLKPNLDDQMSNTQ